MDSTVPTPRTGMSRRSFILGTGVGLAAGAPLGWLGLNALHEALPAGERYSSFTGRSVENPRPMFAMPGPFEGRVVEVRHPAAVKPDNSVCEKTVHAMIDRGM